MGPHFPVGGSIRIRDLSGRHGTLVTRAIRPSKVLGHSPMIGLVQPPPRAGVWPRRDLTALGASTRRDPYRQIPRSCSQRT